MNIKKIPIDTNIECNCGCEFEIHEYDTEKRHVQMGNREYIWSDVTCPYCNKQIVVTPIKEINLKGYKI